jgi:hypothetical protein
MGFDESLAKDRDEMDRARRLSIEAGVPFVDLATQSIDPEAFSLVPEDFARRHLVVAFGIDLGRQYLQVAVRDPFDVSTLDALRQVSGFELELFVATLSHLRGALEWGPPRSKVLRKTAPGTELSSEDTRRVAIELQSEGDLPSSRTSPNHRLDDEATVEQRIEALVLALIESGVISRAQYVDALRRLLHRR